MSARSGSARPARGSGTRAVRGHGRGRDSTPSPTNRGSARPARGSGTRDVRGRGRGRGSTPNPTNHEFTNQSNRQPVSTVQTRSVTRKQPTKNDDKGFGSGNDNWSNKDLAKYCLKYHVMFIMRGLPGSGKSTITEGLKGLHRNEDIVICSADDFRYDSTGNYVYDPDQLKNTHAQCKQKAESSCKKKVHVVVIDNTNIQAFEYHPYLIMAKSFGYSVIFISTKAGDIAELSKRNLHKVPFDKIKKMKMNYKPDPIPYFFNWAIPTSEGNCLKKIISKLMKSCTKHDEHFKVFLQRTLRTSPQTLFQTFNRSATSTTHLHVTAAYTSESAIPTEQSQVYTQSKTVKDSLGLPTLLNVIGIVITKKTLSARLSLTEQQKTVWGRDDSVHGESNPIAFEEKIKHSTRLFKNLEISSTDVNFTPPRGCLRPSHGLGCTAHVTLGTRGNNKPVIAKDIHYQLVHSEASKNPLHEGSVPESVAFRCYDGDVWVVYLRRPITLQALFCGHYDLDKSK